jgi:hypothetical protein
MRRAMWRSAVVVSALIVGAWRMPTARAPGSKQCSPATYIDAALDALGGKGRLNELTTERVTGVQEATGIPWSPHPAEFRPNYEQFSELRDLQRHQLRREIAFQAASHTTSSKYAVTVNVPDSVVVLTLGGHDRLLPRLAVPTFNAGLANEPATVVREALASSDVRCGVDTTIDGTSYNQVEWERGRARLLINSVTALPGSVVRREALPDDADWGQWGDLVTQTAWSAWSLEPNGVRYPRTWTTFRNGMFLERDAILDVAFNVAAPPDSFAIADSLRARARASTGTTPDLSRTSVELDPGVTFIPGRFNVLLVRQDDGVVVIDAPISPAYSRAVMAEANRRYPGLPIKAVVTCDFMWAHFGGVREYIARGIPVYAAMGQERVLRQIANSPHRLAPDSLWLHPIALHVHAVSGRTELRSATNRVELVYAGHPGADYGERMVVAYLPESNLLYTGDLLPTAGEANFVRQGSSAVKDLATEQHFDVKSVLGIHLPVTPWQAVLDTVATIAAR